MELQLAKLPDDVKDQFLTIGDSIEILPLFGRKRSVKLMKTHYRMILRPSYNVKIEGTDIIIPARNGEHGEFHLKLKSTLNGDIYCLESSGEEVFKYNSIYSCKSLLQRRDELILGLNKIILKEKSEGPGEVESSLDRDIVRSNLNILIEGETGTGKSFLAKKIHNESGRTGDFIHLNISALSKGLIESELFGHEKGAFTGASKSRDGAIKRAHQGTLFLDEIDSLSKEMQVKLLLFLDDKRVRAVGGESSEKVDVRLIIASGSPLKSLVKNDIMRSDFFYRVSSGHQLKLLSLRDNKSLIDRYLKMYERDHGVLFSRRLYALYKTMPWPGNIRQLYGHLDRKRCLSKTRFLNIDDIDLEIFNDEIPIEEDHKIISLNRVKEAYIKKAYFRLGEDIVLTAKALNISYNTAKKVILKSAV